MKYSKSSSKKGSNYRRYKRKSNNRTIGKLVHRILNKNIETKKLIYGYTEQALTSGTTYPGTYVSEAMKLVVGTGSTNRIGNWVNAIGFGTRWVLHNNAANCQFVRYLCLINKQGSANTDYTTGTDLFDNSSGTNTSLSTFTTNGYLVRRINKDKYITLVDKIIRLGGEADVGKIYTFKKYFRMKGRKINYDTTSTVQPTNNQIVEIWLTAEADDDVSTTETVELTGQQQFWYKDA